MDSPLTLRLDDETREHVARIARQRRMSTSEVVREAIDAWLKQEETAAKPYERIADLIGAVHSGNRERSSQTGRQFKNLLQNRRKKTRSASARGAQARQGAAGREARSLKTRSASAIARSLKK